MRRRQAAQGRDQIKRVLGDFVRGETSLILITLPIAAAVFFWPVLVGRRFFWEDIVQQFYPSLSYLVNSLRQFRLPYWSPYVFSGIPFIGDVQTQVFYPPNWLLIPFVGPDGRLIFRALEVLVVLHVLVAGCLMYRLAREWQFSHRASLYAGLCFMFSGFMILRTIHLGVIYTYTWFPLLLMFVHRSVVEHRFSWAIAGGLVFGLAALGGYPQTLMHMGYFLGLYVVVLAIIHWPAHNARLLVHGTLALLLVVCVGLGVAAAQYLPSFEYVKHTVRASLGYQDLVEASLRPAQLLTLLVPKFFGSVAAPPQMTDTVEFWAGPGHYYYWETVIYVGIIPLSLAVLGLRAREWRLRWFFLAVTILALVLALGRYTPLYRLVLAIVPMFNRFRIPARLADISTFGLTVLAGLGMEMFLHSGREQQIRTHTKGLLWTLGLVALAWALLAGGVFRSLFREFADSRLYDNVVAQWGTLVMLVVATVIAFAYRARRKSPSPLLFWSVLVATFLDLYGFSNRFNSSPISPDEYPYGRTASLRRIQQEASSEPFRVNMRQGNRMLLGRNQGNLDRIELLEGYTPLGIARYAPFVVPPSHVLDLLNVRYRIDTTANCFASNPGCLPRARMVYRYVLAESDSDAMRRVLAGDFDYRNCVVLESNPGFPSHEGTDVESEVRILRRETDQIILEVTTTETGVLVLSEIYYPEWRARIDNRPARIYPVDFMLRGVTVPAGRHRIEMGYDRGRVTKGVAISVVTLLLALSALVLLRRREDGHLDTGSHESRLARGTGN